ncbi:hypothetical protein EUTSA_v10029438mg [Eutrema salsugineum]|uniref:F-box domain-containing protein n=1 Tax=Eutrema salsugineum TaxID=72664 RepID=V4LES7_EUTSA|nr:hypothetical protein EUTSA_v10029438mg [Eutrema salsugineum]
MISELPDDLLLKILSSLFPEDLIATSVLSRRWRSLWKLVPKLNIGEQHRTKYSMRDVDMIYSSLAFSNPQVLRSLDFKLISYDSEWLEYWTKPTVYHGLRELRFELVYRSLKFPTRLYVCKTLETLILCKLHLVDVPPWACFLSLKTLHLLSVNFSHEESVQKLLSICPVLEDLVVRRSTYVSVEVYTINVPTLRSLSIDYLHAASPPAGVHGFVINAPSLKYLNIRDHLVKANVEVVCDQSKSLLGSLASIQHLSLCSKNLNIPYHADTFFLFLEHLELCTCSAEWCDSLTRILKEAPRLRVLKLKSIHCTSYNDSMECWNQPSSVPECLSSHLQILEWRRYKGTKLEKQLAKYILAKAGHLKMATFSSKATEEHQMFKKLESVPICSKSCQLLFD